MPQNQKSHPVGVGKDDKDSKDKSKSSVAGKTKVQNSEDKNASSGIENKLDAVLKSVLKIEEKVERNKKLINRQQQELDGIIAEKEAEKEKEQHDKSHENDMSKNTQAQREWEDHGSGHEYDYEYDSHGYGDADYEYYETDWHEESGYSEHDYDAQPPAKRRKVVDLAAKTQEIRKANLNDNVVDNVGEKQKESHGQKNQSTGGTSSDCKFKEALDKYKNCKEQKTAGKVNQGVADLANGLFKEGLDRDQFKDLVKSIDRPENCDSLTEVRVNELVWNLLQMPTRTFDEKLQSVQTAMAKTGINLVHIMEMIADPDKQKHEEDILTKGTQAVAMLGHAYHLLCLRRRELHKPDVDWRYANLCSANIEHTHLLYGNNVQEEIKRIGAGP